MSVGKFAISTLLALETHYNRRRPHSSLGPGMPEPTEASISESGHRHKLPTGFGVAKKTVLAGLHHEYRMVKEAA